MNYRQALQYMYSCLPMFSRIGAAAFKPGLANTRALCKRLGNPEKKFLSIHIAGTNGKGSTSHLLAAIMQSAGYKTGLFTSPHLKDYRERVRINGKMIPKKKVTGFISAHRAFFEKQQLSFFEMTAGLGFEYFARQNVDIAIIETGLGGRLDATNVIKPLFSIITNISRDHMNLLGNKLPEIAGEKAGIIKRRVPLIIGETQPPVKKVFEQKAHDEKSPILFADQKFSVMGFTTHPLTGESTCDIYHHDRLILKQVRCGLGGSYQQKNIATVMAAVDHLRQKGFHISEPHIRRGFAEVLNLTGFAGRWQVLTEKPLTIADTAHNEEGVREVMKQLMLFKFRRLHMVVGLVNDKEALPILKLLPRNASYYFCKAAIPRAMDPATLAAVAGKAGLQGRVFSTVKEACKAAEEKAGKDDLIYIGGSTFVVGEAV